MPSARGLSLQGGRAPGVPGPRGWHLCPAHLQVPRSPSGLPPPYLMVAEQLLSGLIGRSGAGSLQEGLSWRQPTL